MNKTLKKTLSIILTIVMIVTTIPFAFAADEKAHDAVAVEFVESDFIKDNQSVNQWDYSSSYAEGPENMLDGDPYSKFCVVIYSNIAFSDLCDYYYVTAKTTDETGVSISGYQFTTGNDAPERDPVSWKLYGSNDNINWTVIDSKEKADITEDRNSEVNFMLDKNSESYKYFRFEFEALREDQTTFQLSEIVLFEQHIAEFESCGGYVCSVCDIWYGEGAASHEKYTNGICDACGYKCTHKGMEDNICDDCGLECAHADAVQDCRGYYCADCLSFYGESGEHTFVNNTCSSCGIKGGSCGDSGDNVIWLLNDDGLLIISGEGNIYDYQADGVASPFGWNSEIKTAVIEDGITNIPSNLFNSCQNLKSVTIGNDVESIGSMAFYYCQSLESVTIGNSVKNIGEKAFLGNDSLKNVVIPDSVKSIGSEAFYRCIGLESLTIGKGVNSIGERAFSECTALESVIIPGNVVTIYDNAFAFCEGLKTLTISEGVKDIGESAFRNCNNLESVMLPNSINSISYGAFYNCPKLESVTIPDSVTSIGNMAFTYCRNLKSITIPNSVTSIGEYAFSSCTSLENIIIGSNVTSIGAEVISSCDALEALHFTGTEKQWEAITKPADAADTINTIAVHFDTFEEKAGFAPTCGTDGHTAILYCTVCDDYVSGEVIPATGDHDWSDASGICTGCGTECPHESITESVCDICGYVEKFSMRIYWGGDKYTDFTVPYGANLMEVITTAEKEGKLLSKGDEMRIVNDKTNGIYYITGAYIFRTGGYITNTDIMPANDIEVTQAQYTYGWFATWDEEDNVRWCYSAKSGTLNEGWHYIEEDYDDVDGGARYYLEPVTTYFGGTLIVRAEGITEIDGKHYYFDELGRFMESFTGIHKGYYFENGVEVVTKAVDNKDGTTHRIVCAEHENCGVVFMAEEEHNIVNDACSAGCGYEYDRPADPTPDTPDEPDVPDEPEQPEEDGTICEYCGSNHNNPITKIFCRITQFFIRLFTFLGFWE